MSMRLMRMMRSVHSHKSVTHLCDLQLPLRYLAPICMAAVSATVHDASHRPSLGLIRLMQREGH